MRRRGLAAAAGGALLFAVLPAWADESTGCSGFKWHIDREETAFAGDALPAVNAGAQIPGVMEAVLLHLAKQDGQTFEIPPSHRPKHNPAYAGVFSIVPIQVAGPYNVTISEEAWIDVIQGGKALRQTGFTGAQGCHDVRKSVRFDLAAGPATIMITDAANETLKIEVLPPPL
jgi:hypothetical protein